MPWPDPDDTFDPAVVRECAALALAGEEADLAYLLHLMRGMVQRVPDYVTEELLTLMWVTIRLCVPWVVAAALSDDFSEQWAAAGNLAAMQTIDPTIDAPWERIRFHRTHYFGTPLPDDEDVLRAFRERLRAIWEAAVSRALTL